MLWHGNNFRGIINKAKEMIFDNTGTDLISTNAEDAIKEVNSNLNELSSVILGNPFNHTINNLSTGWLSWGISNIPSAPTDYIIVAIIPTITDAKIRSLDVMKINDSWKCSGYIDTAISSVTIPMIPIYKKQV